MKTKTQKQVKEENESNKERSRLAKEEKEAIKSVIEYLKQALEMIGVDNNDSCYESPQSIAKNALIEHATRVLLEGSEEAFWTMNKEFEDRQAFLKEKEKKQVS